jgi:hypothetical protein
MEMPFFDPSIPLFKLKHLIEREMQAFRAYLGLDSEEPIVAIVIADWLGLEVKYPGDLRFLSPQQRIELVRESGRSWSAMTCHLPNGIIVTVLNPSHSKRRQQATLMEEVAHVHFRHTPTTIDADPITGMMKRSYDKRSETEAYWFGCATLAPKSGLRTLFKRGYTPMEIAEYYGVSYDLIKFRTNLCGLRKLAG